VYHDDSADDNNASDPSFLQTIARLPHVDTRREPVCAERTGLGPDGAPDTDAEHRLFDSSVTNLASLDGLLFGQDRLTFSADAFSIPLDRTRWSECRTPRARCI